MAQAAVLTVNAFPSGVDNTQHETVLCGVVTFTGSGGYTTGGVPLNWANLVNADGSKFTPTWGPNTTKPFIAYFTPQDTSLVQYTFNAAGNSLFAQTAGAQLAAATTLSGVIVFEAYFARGI